MVDGLNFMTAACPCFDMWLLKSTGPRVVMITIVLVCHLGCHVPVHQQDNNNYIGAALIILMGLEVSETTMAGNVELFRRLL
jgi:hypothetical protein